jgi:hypothetical protein
VCACVCVCVRSRARVCVHEWVDLLGGAGSRVCVDYARVCIVCVCVRMRVRASACARVCMSGWVSGWCGCGVISVVLLTFL